MSFCPNCGTKNANGARFCEKCGIRLEEPERNQKNGVRKAPREISMVKKITIVEMMILAVMLCFFWIIGSSESNPESVAGKYFRAYANQDWEKVYDLSGYSTGKFLQKEQFVEMMSARDTQEITDFEITADGQTSKVQRSFSVQYITDGEDVNYEQLRLLKQSEKRMVLFDSWKVVSDADLAENFSIYVPTGAEVTVDEIALTASDMSESMNEDVDCYTITLFEGTHQLQVSFPWCEIYETSFQAYTDHNFSAPDMILTEEGEAVIQAKLQETLEMFYQAAVEKKDFSEIEDLFLDEYKEEGKEIYDNLVSGLWDSEYYTLNQITFHDFEYSIYMRGNQSIISTEMTYDYDMVYTYTYGEKSENRSHEGDSYLIADFGYDGETYKLTRVNLYSVL